jgi:hypothetical protein
MRNWLGIIFSVIGICALSAVIWFVGPLIAIADVRPLAGLWTRLIIILILFTALFGYIAYKLYKRRKAAQELEAAMTESAEPDSDADVLSERMKDALLTLRKSRRTRGDFLYELPWYIIIGPPGAGKTTALVNSGLKFPLAKGAGASAMAGVGGTRYCDWWFTEEAVLIDTAGRYTTQDSDASSDRRSWLAFLDLLKKDRPKQPINGVMVVISLADLMTLDAAEISAHATAVRKRLTELHEQLEVDFPVYAIFTKADLVSGFIEYFGNFSEERRRMVWGATFNTDDKSLNLIGEAPGEFDLLISRLTEEMPDRLQEEPDPIARTRIYGFPAQMAALKQAVTGFLNEVFEPTRYHTKFALRGFYFTSGTQEGTPIDRVIGAMSSSFGRGMVEPSAYSGMAKSFFLGDLLSKVIFAEAGWVSFNPKGGQARHDPALRRLLAHRHRLPRRRWRVVGELSRQPQADHRQRPGDGAVQGACRAADAAARRGRHRLHEHARCASQAEAHSGRIRLQGLRDPVAPHLRPEPARAAAVVIDRGLPLGHGAGVSLPARPARRKADRGQPQRPGVPLRGAQGLPDAGRRTQCSRPEGSDHVLDAPGLGGEPLPGRRQSPAARRAFAAPRGHAGTRERAPADDLAQRLAGEGRPVHAGEPAARGPGLRVHQVLRPHRARRRLDRQRPRRPGRRSRVRDQKRPTNCRASGWRTSIPIRGSTSFSWASSKPSPTSSSRSAGCSARSANSKRSNASTAGWARPCSMPTHATSSTPGARRSTT